MATSDIKSFAGDAGAEVLSQAEYELLTSIRADGFPAGILPRVQLNKVLRQLSLVSAAVAKYAADTSGTDVVDDGDVAALAAKLATAIGTTSAGANGALLPVDTITGTTYTIVAGDLNRCKRFTSASSVTVTVPAGPGIIPSFNCILRQAGAGTLTLVPDSGVTVQSPSGLLSGGTGASLMLHKTGVDAWDLAGDLAGTSSVGAFATLLAGTGSGQGASLVGVQDAGALLNATTVEAALQEIAKNNDDHEGLLSYGTQAGATAALTAAATALSSGGTVYMKGGTWTLPTGFSTAVWRFSIVGQGKNVTNFLFTPGATATALKFDAGGGSGYNENAVRYIGFSGGADTSAKTAIEYVNAANCEIQGVAIATGSWLGDSIGVKASGRQLLRITDSKFACARPIVYAQNTYFTSLNVDHFLLENSELVGTSATRPCIEFSDGCAFSNMTIRNIAIVQGQDGILWNDTSSTAASFALSIQNVRIEQGLDATAWAIRLESTAQVLQTVSLDNVRFDINRNGLKLRNAQVVTIRNCQFAMASTKTAIDMTFVAGSRLLIENCAFGVNKVLTLTNARLVRTEKNTSGLICAEYVFDAGAAASMTQFGTPVGGPDISITTAGTAIINDHNFAGFVFIVHSGRVSAIFAVTGTSLTTIEVADPSARYSITSGTANSNNLYYSGNNLTLENRDPAAATLTYNVIFLGRSTA